MLAFATKPSLRSTIAVVAVIMLSVLLTLSGAVPVTAAPTRPDPQPNALVRRQIPMPITASAGPRRWCCRERGRCVTTNCQPRVANGRRSFGARGFPTRTLHQQTSAAPDSRTHLIRRPRKCRERMHRDHVLKPMRPQHP
ncbi:hypothetical protein BCR44DRAFT_211336 [Catenaria anguillulae PL171]|uniref:Secreted protein n=1 Tax=Catenaria anguillulae PL171 TaxID=765915 RepID=A0A1Y2I000_9FUNG|nr:hypothetical protein BCR44DRAFT_211336 [Catenaria anguillulae PL171]